MGTIFFVADKEKRVFVMKIRFLHIPKNAMIPADCTSLLPLDIYDTGEKLQMQIVLFCI